MAAAAALLARVSDAEPEVDETQLRVSAPVRDRMGALAAVIGELDAEDVALRRPTLDEVFLELTEMSVRWAVADTWTLTGRALAHWARQPFVLLVGVLFPVLILLMFAYLLRGGYGADYPELLVPGMLALTTVFGLETHDDRGGHGRPARHHRPLPLAAHVRRRRGRRARGRRPAARARRPHRADAVRLGDRVARAHRRGRFRWPPSACWCCCASR